MDKLLKEICLDCTSRDAVRLDNHRAFVEYSKEFAPGCGITVCGEIDENGLHMDYYFPYYKTDTISSTAELTIEKHMGKDSYAGLCDDLRFGATIIFYVQNAAAYQKECLVNWKTGKNELSTGFTCLASSGKILLPLYKDAEQILIEKQVSNKRSHLIAQAKEGDEEAIESLTMEDMDTYNMIARRIQNEDIYSIVDTLFMPAGMECDIYQMVGEILSYQKVQNKRTKEYLYQMKVLCNDTEMDVIINEADLLGDPDVGRRFKGEIWMQGNIHFPSEI